jgi:soluble lytic murein transglycosylase-like protein
MSLPLIALIFALAGTVPAHAETPWQDAVAQASQRFGIPENWIHSVIKSESGGDAQAVSPKGAIGLMQLMPETWADMRSAHDLGPDPFDPPANILAGTAYLKAMYDRFGYPAMFAAYNAGPGRYEDFLRTGKSLPDETRAYVSGLGKRLAVSLPEHPSVASGTRLFFRLSTVTNTTSGDENPVPSDGLFVRLSGQKAGAQ